MWTESISIELILWVALDTKRDVTVCSHCINNLLSLHYCPTYFQSLYDWFANILQFLFKSVLSLLVYLLSILSCRFCYENMWRQKCRNWLSDFSRDYHSYVRYSPLSFPQNCAKRLNINFLNLIFFIDKKPQAGWFNLVVIKFYLKY